MTKQKFWIRDTEGVYAQVEGAEARDQWTKVRGWVEADEPGPTDQVHVLNENPEITQGHPVPYGALEAWAGYGFYPAAPPEPVDHSKPAEVQPVPVAEASKPTKAPAAAGGDTKEK